MLYSITPLASALRWEPLGRRRWSDTLLLFGTPTAFLLLQAPLVGHFRFGLAVSAGLAGSHYLGLGALVGRRARLEPNGLAQAYFGIAATLLTLAIPFAFGAGTTVGLWAVEGAATVWLSWRRQHRFGYCFGGLVQLAAGFWLGLQAAALPASPAFSNPIFFGGILVAGGGLFSAFLTRAGPLPTSIPSRNLWFGWGITWWYLSFGFEILRVWHAETAIAALLLLVSLSGTIGELVGRRWAWSLPRALPALTLPVLTLSLLSTAMTSSAILRGAMGWSLPLAFAAEIFALRSRESAPAPLPGPTDIQHTATIWLITLVLVHDVAIWADHWSDPPSHWPTLSVGLLTAALTTFVRIAVRAELWPAATHRKVYTVGYLVPVTIFLIGWLVCTNLRKVCTTAAEAAVVGCCFR